MSDPGGHDPTQVRAIAAGDLVDADPTPGMRRQRAFAVPGLWAGLVHTEPGAVSGWHHHGGHRTSLFVVCGVMRLESGRDGTRIAEAGPGDFLLVPPGAVHRESNPGAVPSTAVIARAGYGTPTINVEAPGAARAEHAGGAPARPGGARRFRAMDVPAPSANARYLEHHRTPALSVGTAAVRAGGTDDQQVHGEDEVYIVVSGSAVLRTAQTDLPAQLGDVLVVPAGLEHRFVEAAADFRVVVVFGPAEGTVVRS